MASIKMGAIVTDIKGKLGGHVFQKGNQSRVLKTGGKPRITRSDTFKQKSANLATVRQDWSSLSGAQKNDWNKKASEFNFQNAFSDYLQYNGYQFFLKVNCTRLLIALPVLTNPAGIILDLGITNPTGAEVNLSNSTYRTIGSSSIAPYVNLISVQRVSHTGRKIDPNRFVSFSSSVGFPGSNNVRFVQLQNVIGPIASGDIIYIGVQSISQWGFKTAIKWVQLDYV